MPSVSEPSPNASILPAPLAVSPSKTTARDAGHAPSDPLSDAGAVEPPRALREDEVLPAEAELRLAPGLSLEARFRWFDAPPARVPESNLDAIGKARDKTSLDLTVELSSLGRLRLTFGSRAYPFAAGSELRARDDRYGHILVWPAATLYTPVPPGMLRALLGEARLDMTPLAEPVVVTVGPGSMLGSATQKLRLETSIGRLDLEQSVTALPNTGAALWCRLLVELLAAAPDVSACRPDAVPLRAEYTWASGARFELEVTKLTKKPELPIDGLAVPPVRADVRYGELPALPFVALVEDRELADFRTRAVPPAEKPDATAPKLGLVFQNRSDGPRYLLVDGVPVVWLRPDAEWLVSGLKPGRYSVQARDFFGAASSPVRTLELPARFLASEEAAPSAPPAPH